MPKIAATQQMEPQPKRDLLGPSVGQRIRAVRHKRGLSLAQVGGQDLSRSFLSLVESGKSRISLRALAIVAERLETPIGHLLQDEDAQLGAELALDFAEIELERGNPGESVKTIDRNPRSYESDARAQWLMGRAYMDLDRLQDAVRTLRHAIDLADPDDEALLAAEISYSLGRSLYMSNSYEEAEAALRRGLRLALAAGGDPGLQARLTVLIGHIYYVQNQSDQAVKQYDRARELFGSMYDLGNVAAVFSAMSLTARKKGDMEAALRYSKQSLAALRLKRDWKLLARALNNIAMNYLEMGALETAEQRAREAVQRAHEASVPDEEALSRATLAAVLLRQGEMDRAEQEASEAERLAPSHAPLAQVDAWLVLGEIAGRRGKHERADELYTKSLETLRRLGHSNRFADTALDYSLLLRKRGKTDEALEIALQAAQAKGSRVA